MPVNPAYVIHRYTDEIYKIVSFKCAWGDYEKVRLPLPKEEQQVNDDKLANNISRARSMVFQYALCNPWDYFFTGTLDRSKYDRYNLSRFMSSLTQWVRDMRKKYAAKFQVLLIPELHKDGAWHVHGFVYGLPMERLAQFPDTAPLKLREGGFLNWPDYAAKFGFCSLAPIRDPVACAFYITKYISKDLAQRGSDLGQHLYFHSRPLKTAEKASAIYCRHRALDALCDHHYDFCDTGMVEDQNFAFPYIWDGAEYPEEDMHPRPLADPLQAFDPGTVDFDYEQLKMEGYL